jgi:hypothetical protein
MNLGSMFKQKNHRVSRGAMCPCRMFGRSVQTHFWHQLIDEDDETDTADEAS